MIGATPAGGTTLPLAASIWNEPGGTSGSGTCLTVTTMRTRAPSQGCRQQLADVADRQLVEDALRPRPVLEHHDAVRAGGRDRARLRLGGLQQSQVVDAAAPPLLHERPRAAGAAAHRPAVVAAAAALAQPRARDRADQVARLLVEVVGAADVA